MRCLRKRRVKKNKARAKWGQVLTYGLIKNVKRGTKWRVRELETRTNRNNTKYTRETFEEMGMTSKRITQGEKWASVKEIDKACSRVKDEEKERDAHVQVLKR